MRKWCRKKQSCSCKLEEGVNGSSERNSWSTAGLPSSMDIIQYRWLLMNNSYCGVAMHEGEMSSWGDEKGGVKGMTKRKITIGNRHIGCGNDRARPGGCVGCCTIQKWQQLYVSFLSYSVKVSFFDGLSECCFIFGRFLCIIYTYVFIAGLNGICWNMHYATKSVF
jgi:hypothetical protein